MTGGPPDFAEYHKVRMTHLYENAGFRFRSAADFAQLVLKSILAANGGAIIAMLTFLGNSERTPAAAQLLWLAFASFLLGLIASLVASFLAYVTQGDYARQDAAGADKIYAFNIRDAALFKSAEEDEDQSKRRGNLFEYCAVGLFATALLAFSIGAALGVASLTSIPAAKVIG